MTLLPARMRSRGSPRSLLAGCEVEQTLPKAVWQFSYKTLIIRTSGHAPRYLPNELKTQPLRSTIYADRKKNTLTAQAKSLKSKWDSSFLLYLTLFC